MLFLMSQQKSHTIMVKGHFVLKQKFLKNIFRKGIDKRVSENR